MIERIGDAFRRRSKISQEGFMKLAEKEKNIQERLDKVNKSIMLSEQAITRQEKEAESIIGEFITVSKTIKESGRKDIGEMKSMSRREVAAAR
jgi:hypothetical protein